MPTLPPTYFARYVNGAESFTAVSYNLQTMAWTITANGAQRVAIDSSDPDEQALLINDSYVMFVLTDGEVQCGDITKFATASIGTPRLDFMRQTDSVPRKFASLDQNGTLSCYDLNEKLAPTGLDRMYLLGNPNCSLGVDGLLTAGFSAIDILVQQGFVPGQGPYLVDQNSKMLARLP
jgi:hypothetical protein